MGLALYRKYRSSSLDEVIGQDHIVKTIQNMVSRSNIPHAFLLTGPRGVGKTSVARLLACKVNNIDFKDIEKQVDIIEIDAASNRKIDEIREIREQVNIVPTSLKYKVYIVDEVHMLTREAFNALLKTLEEPPEHVIFILATTEFHKLPPTIISRCIRFHFKPISVGAISKHLESIAIKEKIDIDKDAVEVISRHSDGSFRDGITLLENFRSFGKKVTKTDVEDNLGLANESIVSDLISSIESSDTKNIFSIIDQLEHNGINYALLANRLSEHFRDCIVSGNSSLQRDKIVRLLDGLLDVQTSAQPKQKLSICLLHAVVESTPVAQRTAVAPKEEEAKASEVPKTPKQEKIMEAPEHQKKSPAKEPATKSIDEAWDKTLDTLKNEQNTIYAITRMGKISSFLDNNLVVEFKFPFHAKRMSDDRNKKLVEQYLSTHLGSPIQVSFSVTGEQADEKNIQNISNIFGEAEVLE